MRSHPPIAHMSHEVQGHRPAFSSKRVLPKKKKKNKIVVFVVVVDGVTVCDEKITYTFFCFELSSVVRSIIAAMR